MNSSGPTGAEATIAMQYVLRIRAADRGIFRAIRAGKKKVETRPATARYRKVAAGDTLLFLCGSERLVKKVKRAGRFKTLSGLVKKYKPQYIHPAASSIADLRAMYDRFPGFAQKLKKDGLMAFEL